MEETASPGVDKLASTNGKRTLRMHDCRRGPREAGSRDTSTEGPRLQLRRMLYEAGQLSS